MFAIVRVGSSVIVVVWRGERLDEVVVLRGMGMVETVKGGECLLVVLMGVVDTVKGSPWTGGSLGVGGGSEEGVSRGVVLLGMSASRMMRISRTGSSEAGVCRWVSKAVGFRVRGGTGYVATRRERLRVRKIDGCMFKK